MPQSRVCCLPIWRQTAALAATGSQVDWVLPEPAEHVYFVGPWRLITPDMLREALRRDVSTLRVRVATSWAPVPLNQLRSCLPMLRKAARVASPIRQAMRRVIGATRRKSRRRDPCDPAELAQLTRELPARRP